MNILKMRGFRIGQKINDKKLWEELQRIPKSIWQFIILLGRAPQIAHAKPVKGILFRYTEAMVEINPQITIDDNELEFTFIRADGPGGQNVNKVATAVQLRFDIQQNSSLPGEVKSRLIKLAGKRVTQDGILVLEARRFRTQEHNREDALARFTALVQKALETPKKRKRTKPSQAAVEKRLDQKKQRGEVKRSRQKFIPDE